MNFEVVVVGGGIGGLVTAALLAARGVNVGLFERQSHVGGCVANFDHHGYQFEPTCGLYSGWETGGIYDSVFSQLPVAPPQVEPLSPAYVVRLPDGVDVPVTGNENQFYENLRGAFPECADAAIAFYRAFAQPGDDADKTVAAALDGCSHRFQRFVDVQLQTFTQSSSAECLYDQATRILDPSRRFWMIRGGSQSLADNLANSLKKSCGTLRLNAPVLRLAYDSAGLPIGVDLLNGERVNATRAIVSDLTVWDTYGKLVGVNRTPSSIRSQLKKLRGWGAYLLFLGLDRPAASRLPSNRMLALTDWLENQPYDPEGAQFFLSAVTESDRRAPNDKLAVTVSTFTRAEDWFSFHEDHNAHEAQDQSALESLWSRLHAAMPELGDSVEVIETATPQTFYETTRRKFGMVGRAAPAEGAIETALMTAPFPNLFLTGDTVAQEVGIEGVVKAAYQLANRIAPNQQ